MKINKKDIIDEIISLEPELINDRKKLEIILEDIINIKPNIKISPEFKSELKEKLLTEIKEDSDIYINNKYSYLKFFISFIFGGVTAFSLIGILGINLNFLNPDKTINTEFIGTTEFQEVPEIKIQRTRSMNAEISTMSVNTDSVDIDKLDESNTLFTELKNYLENLGLENKEIEEILNILKKYK